MPYVFHNLAIGPNAPQGQKVRVTVKKGAFEKDETWELGFNQKSPALAIPAKDNSIKIKAMELKDMKPARVPYNVANVLPAVTLYIIEHTHYYALTATTLDSARSYAERHDNQYLLKYLP